MMQLAKLLNLLIAPQLTDLIKSKSKGLSQETLKELIDELIPLSERGRWGVRRFHEHRVHATE